MRPCPGLGGVQRQKGPALGDGPKEADEERPPQAKVFAKGDVAQIISVPGAAAQIEQLNPELKGKLGYFPIPGRTAKAPGSVFTGGSADRSGEGEPKAPRVSM